ncbi:Chromosome (plasmid) partitioning protein ParB [Candidatus Syntrophocurvum alkaliphilum]|uniref:Chromosome (Plasmid) partitioning protein ParB n=1 Tax=Candidatus Syntrophocurvum alkaliphilum TaxID=2293317 RepID=A0A6I6DIZ1_9FIRM|nr:ParB/RepB/Spo0J family partition protein [Candidatus Syntrophocurvum alkaliphilum]QGU00619.1 Chromosome (plasmid) partitioning protein ParB [Candidatus Syntrophocurvum alkaliphilum]
MKNDRGLGRGLEALFSNDGEVDNSQIIELDIREIIPKLDQPRKNFDDDSLFELANSIREHGLLQPVLVRPKGTQYEIIAGERRWRAAEIAELNYIPVLIREIDDIEAAEISLIENIQREDLSAVEEALAYKNMIDKYNFKQDELAERVGKSRAHIANTLRILSLPSQILDMLENRKLSSGHARALLSLESDEEKLNAANDIVSLKLSVRETESAVKSNKRNSKTEKDTELVELQEKLQELLGTKVEMKKKKNGGKIEISFYGDEDLERLLDYFGIEE